MRTHAATLALSALAAASLAAPALGQDVFTPGERWSDAPAASAPSPWIPEDVRFVGDGAFVWVSRRGGDASAALYDAVDAPGGARAVLPRRTDEVGVARIAAGMRGDRVFALVQREVQATGRRRMTASAHDPTTAEGGGALLADAWTFTFPTEVDGASLIDSDAEGRVVVAAGWDGQAALARIWRLDGTTGAVLAGAALPAVALDALSVSGDGERVAVAAGLDLYVLDADLQTLHSEDLSSSTPALDVSADGRVVAFGGLGGLHVITETGGAYAPAFTDPPTGPELPTRVALSADGGRVAASWWNHVQGTSARLVVMDTTFGAPLNGLSMGGISGQRQNLPVAARISPDGARAAFALWGDGNSQEVVMIDVDALFAPPTIIDLPGSARGLDLDASGTRMAIASKDVHAQVFGNRGELRLHDTGERAVQVTRTPTLGGAMDLAARRPGAPFGWFLLGTPDPAAAPGGLLLDRSRVRVLAALADPTGRMDLSLGVPINAPSLIGSEIHVQAAFREAGAIWFTPRLARTYVLRP